MYLGEMPESLLQQQHRRELYVCLFAVEEEEGEAPYLSTLLGGTENPRPPVGANPATRVGLSVALMLPTRMTRLHGRGIDGRILLPRETHTWSALHGILRRNDGNAPWI